MTNHDEYELSLRHVEAGAAAHRASLEGNRVLRDQLEHVKIELAKAIAENDHLRIANHDLVEKLAAIEKLHHAEVANRAEYWNTIQGVAALILNVKQRVDPTERLEEPPAAPRVPQDARNGDGSDLPRAFLPARHRLVVAPPESDRG